MKRFGLALFIVFAALFAPAPAAASCTGTALCAGAASVDMTWHVGSGQGQYGSEGNGFTSDKFDPFHHQTKMVPSDGFQSRTFAKAIVIEGHDPVSGGRVKVAYVKTELYLQQDVLTRRVGELVSGADPLVPDFAVPGLRADRVMLGATHNHSAPEYASTAFGVMLFTDTFDFRMFETTARKIAEAVKLADGALEPARLGASVVRFGEVQRNILGPGVADDGTPAGFPHDYFDDELSVIRFERLDGTPVAAWVNLGMHPESIATVDLVSADFVGMVERLAERDLGRPAGAGATDGPIVVWSQGSVGDVEPDQSRARLPSAKREYWHRNFAQCELMSEKIAAAVRAAWDDVPAGTAGVVEKHVPFTAEAPVGMVDYRFAGPVTHPEPTVSNCRSTEPGVPVVGLPDCERDFEGLEIPEQLGTTIGLLKDAGVPIPDNYGAPSHEGVQETHTIHLQAMRLGEILVGSCPCEPVSDMVKNFKSRADATVGNFHHGYEWECRPAGSDWECNYAQAAWRPDDWRPVPAADYEHMVAQIRNDASGWEDDLGSVQGEIEAKDPAEIYGNFTHEELDAATGYRLPIMIGQANDYVGYIVTYREYSRGDHYRKALTAFGPHTADYVNTRLVRMGAELRGGPAVEGGVHQPVVGAADELISAAKALTVGKGSTVGLAAYDAAIPDDGGAPGAVGQPASPVERFRAATFIWIGGSNWTDNPEVRVLDANDAVVATQEGGEVVLTLDYDSPFSTAPLDWLLGNKVYRWTATWEVFEKTPPGPYRFAVKGRHRSGRAPVDYALQSEPFDVVEWRGIEAYDLRRDGTDAASFLASGVERTIALDALETDDDAELDADEIHYPDTYASDLDFISGGISASGAHLYCYRCTFRPWANTGRITSATLTVHRDGGGTTTHPATLVGGRWTASGLSLAPGDFVTVEPGGVVDEHGNFNGAGAEEESQ